MTATESHSLQWSQQDKLVGWRKAADADSKVQEVNGAQRRAGKALVKDVKKVCR
jgi:hypothetical protein